MDVGKQSPSSKYGKLPVTRNSQKTKVIKKIKTGRDIPAPFICNWFMPSHKSKGLLKETKSKRIELIPTNDLKFKV